MLLPKLMNLHWHIIITQSPGRTLGSPLCCMHCRYGQMYDDMHAFLQYHTEYFHCPSVFCFRLFKLLLLQLTATQGKHSTFYCFSRVLPFLEGYRVRLLQYVEFSDRLLFLRNIHVSFPCVFSRFDISFLFSVELSGYTTICLSIHLLKDISVASRF